jgi:hypothetical protein
MSHFKPIPTAGPMPVYEYFSLFERKSFPVLFSVTKETQPFLGLEKVK